MSKKLAGTKKPKKDKSFPIVAIGASAGGLEAVTELLDHLPENTGMSFVYIQHTDPSHKSKIDQVLSRRTKMKVEPARSRMRVQPNCIYVLPANKDMIMSDGMIVTSPKKSKTTIPMPIDKFFLSLADNHKDGAIGIVLSGSANDGTLGLKAIKTAGGLTLAQDDSAKFQSMPKSAIAEGAVDLVLSPQEIALELKRIGDQSDVIRQVMSDLNDSEISNHDENLINIIQLLKKNIGVDFTHYKMNTIRRRVIRRMLLYKYQNLKDYYQYLKHHTAEVNVLYQDLLINVTSFFRDTDSFEYLKKVILPKVIKSKPLSESIRIWVPACSTGEEAYSIAILLFEILGERAANTPIHIFATDLSELAIAKARLGVYSRNDLVDVSPKRLQRFFSKIDGNYRIMKSIRDVCVFAPHNILKDPPFSRIDLISCCNVMIYLEPVLQKKIISTFHYALNGNGYLMLGKSETINASTHLFTQTERKYKIYAKKKDAGKPPVYDMNYRLPLSERTERMENRNVLPKVSIPEEDLEKILDNLLVTQYAPACVVVSQDLEMLYFRGGIKTFLEPSPGKASLNLLKMAKQGLAFEIRNIVHKSIKSGQKVKKEGLEIQNNNATQRIAIEVVPLRLNTEEKFFMIIFEELPLNGVGTGPASLSKDKVVKRLQAELASAKDDMRSIIEEQEASNEELQSANEEIVSSNEELQSINEELETSKEEVESTNEELMTINSELQVRNEQLAESYEYAEAIVDTIREAVLVLDKDLRVKTANKSFYKLFQTREEETEGYLIYELGNKQWSIPRLRQFLEEIIPENIHFNGFEVRHVFPTIGEKVMRLNGRRVVQKTHNQLLVLLAIEDVTEHKQAEHIIAEREAWFRNMADNAPVMIWVINAEKICTFLNRTWLDFTGRNIDARINDWLDAIHPDDMQRYLQLFHSSFNEKQPFNIEYRLRRYDGQYRWIMDMGKPTSDTNGKFTGYIGSCAEIHDRRIVSDELEQKVNQRTQDLMSAIKNLEISNSELEQFAYVASHDLQEPLRKLTVFADRLNKSKADLPEDIRNYIGKMTESSTRMSNLINDLLNFSRITAPDKMMVKTDLNVVLKDVLPDFDVLLKEKKAKIHSENLPTIQGLPLQLGQLFHNLISNSLKFTRPEAAPVINIFSRVLMREDVQRFNLAPGQKYVEILFRDNGLGFSTEFAEQIFVIFQRLHNNSEFPGTGIGLALCKKIVLNHGGVIFAESEENEGATFHVILPMEQY